MHLPRLHPRSSSDRYLFELLLALELLMSFTLFGYIHIPPISVTTAYLPILLAGCLLGPLESTVMGFAFGLASMFKASAGYVMPFDQLFSPFQSGYPFRSLLLSVGARTLFGLLIGLAYLAARKSRHPRAWSAVISALGPRFHALLVAIVLGICFPASAQELSSSLFNWGDVVTSLFCLILVTLVQTLLQSAPVRRFRTCIDQSSQNPYLEKTLIRLLVGFGLFIMLLTVMSAIYFAQRSTYMLSRYGITVSSGVASDTLHLQIQFLFATLSLNAMSILVMLSTYKYMSYQKYLGELDALTNVMGRRMFLANCEHLQGGWFLFLDVDDFKSINDTFGHSTGDRTLCRVADSLQAAFADCGIVGRMGGDEFAVLLPKPLPAQELTRRLDQFLAGLAAPSGSDPSVSCSIGVSRYSYPQELEALLKFADQLLYDVKRSGKGRYLIRDFDSRA